MTKHRVDLKDLDEKLRLVKIFKEKRPATFYDAYVIAMEAGIGKNKEIKKIKGKNNG
jgi:hypothetical protein